MSHNKIKVGGQNPNASGEISVSLNNLSNVSTASASNGVLLKYFNSWTFGLPGFVSTDFALIASNRTTGGVTAVYDSTSLNSILTDSRNSGYGTASLKGSASQFTHLFQSGTTFSGGASKRYSGFELPANSKFLLIFVHAGKFTNSTGESVLQWIDENNNSLGPQVKFQDSGRGSKKLFGYIEVGGSSIKVFPTCISTSLHRRGNYADGDSWQAIRIG